MMNESDRVALNNSALSTNESASITGGDIFNHEDGNITITSSALAVAIVGQRTMSRTKSQ